MSNLLKLAVLVLVAAAGFAVGVCRNPKPAPVEPKIVVVPDTVLIEATPDTVWSWRERIRYVEAPPEVIRTSEGTPDTIFIRRFCAPPPPVTPGYDSRPLLPRFAGKYEKSRLTLWATRSDGSLYEQAQEARAPFQFSSRDTTIFVQEARQWPKLLRLTLPPLLCGGAALLASGRASIETSAALGAGCLAGAVAF